MKSVLTRWPAAGNPRQFFLTVSFTICYIRTDLSVCSVPAENSINNSQNQPRVHNNCRSGAGVRYGEEASGVLISRADCKYLNMTKICAKSVYRQIKSSIRNLQGLYYVVVTLTFNAVAVTA